MTADSRDSEPVADGHRDAGRHQPSHNPALNPVMSRHQLGLELRALREAHGLRLEDVAAKLGLGPGTVSRIETGKAPTRTSYLTVMLDVYGVGDTNERQRLMDLALSGRRASWLIANRELLPPGVGRYMELEASATTVCCFANQLIPGMVQTSEYAAEACRISRPTLATDQVGMLAYLQVRRRERLESGKHELHVVIDEAALVRPVGSPAAMASQLDSLYTASTWPQVTIQVLPLRRAWPVLSMPFALLTFPDGSDMAAYCGISGQVITSGRANDVSALRERFAALAAGALPAAQSAQVMAQRARVRLAASGRNESAPKRTPHHTTGPMRGKQRVNRHP